MIAAAAVAAVAIAFAPPLDHALRYRTIETRPSATGAPTHDSIDQDVRFARDGDGYLLTLTAVAYSTDAAARRALDAAIAPTIGVPLRLRLDRDGIATSVADGAANWAAVIAGMRAAAALSGDPRRREAVEAFASISAAEREAQLLQAAADILPAAGARIAHRHDDQVRKQPDGSELLIEENIEVSPASGLIVSRRRVLRGRADASATAVPLGETVTRIIAF